MGKKQGNPPREGDPLTRNEDLQFLPLGIGDFFSCFHYCSSFVVLAGGVPILIDCPSPLRKMLYEATVRAGIELTIDQVDQVVLTHLHGDHANGLEELAFYKRFFQNRRPILYTIPEVVEEMWEHRLRAAMGTLTDENCDNGTPQQLSDYFDVHVCEEGEAVQCGPVTLEIRRTRHFLPCFGLRVSFGGLTLGYSSDTVFDPAHIDFLSSSDLIIHETSAGSGHTPVGKLASLSEPIRRKMFLIHVPDGFDMAASPIPVLEEGRLYSLRGLLKSPTE